MIRARHIFGIVLGGVFVVLAGLIGIRSLSGFIAPEKAFAFLATVPRRDTNLAHGTETTSVNKRAAPKAVKAPPKKEFVPIVIPAPPQLATAITNNVPSSTMPTPLPITNPSVPVMPSPVPAPPPIVPPPTEVSPSPLPLPPPVPAITPAPDPVESVAARLLITEVMVGSDGSGNDEFIELFNPTDTTVDLTGWSIKKQTSSGSESSLVAQSRLQGKLIAAQTYFLIVHDGAAISGPGVDAFWAKSNTLAAKNNAIILYDSSGQIIDKTMWTEIPKNASWARQPISSSSFAVQDVPTPKQ